MSRSPAHWNLRGSREPGSGDITFCICDSLAQWRMVCPSRPPCLPSELLSLFTLWGLGSWVTCPRENCCSWHGPLTVTCSLSSLCLTWNQQGQELKTKPSSLVSPENRSCQIPQAAVWGWRDGLMVMSDYCSSRGLGLTSRHLCWVTRNCLQLQIWQNWLSFWPLQNPEHTWHVHTHEEGKEGRERELKRSA